MSTDDLPVGTARALARWRGLKHYIGATCKYCGSTRRYVVNRNCIDCDRAKHTDPDNHEYLNLYQKTRRKNIERTPQQKAKDIARSKRWRELSDHTTVNARKKRLKEALSEEENWDNVGEWSPEDELPDEDENV